MGWVDRFFNDPIDAITDNKITDHPLEAAALGAGLYFGLPALTGMGWGEMGSALSGGLGEMFSASAGGTAGGAADAALGSGLVEGSATSAFPAAVEAGGAFPGLDAAEMAMTPGFGDGAVLAGNAASATAAPSLEIPFDMGSAGGLADGMAPPVIDMGTSTSMPSMGGLGDMWDGAKEFYNTYGKPIQGGLMLANGLQSVFANKENGSMYRNNMSQINNMYAPGSPEYNALWEQMSREDAAKGRRSQTGVRSTDLAAKLAQARMQALTSGGYQQSMQGAAGSNLGSYAGISAGLGQLFGSK